MFVGVARLTLEIPESGSLKAKRQVLRRVTDRVKARFNASVAEVGENDTWQRAVIGLTVVGNEARHVNEQLDKIIHFVEEMYVAPLIARELEIVPFGGPLHGAASRRGDEDDELQEDLPLEIPRGERSLAEAEGIPWEDRHVAAKTPKAPAPAVSKRGAAASGRPPKALSLEEARARARALRNPRDWEKE